MQQHIDTYQEKLLMSRSFGSFLSPCFTNRIDSQSTLRVECKQNKERFTKNKNPHIYTL